MAAKVSEKDLETLKLVIERFNRSESYCQSWHDNASRHYKAYRFFRNRAEYPYKHNVKDRLTFTMVEVLTAKIMQQIFAVQPIIAIVPTEEADLEIARQLQQVISVLLQNPDREFFIEFADFVKQCLIYGTSYLSVTPRFNITNWSFDGLNFDCEDYQDIFPDPAAKRLTRAKFVIKRSIHYWDDIKELEKQGVYRNVDLIKGATVADYDNKVKERLADVGLQSGVDLADPETDTIEILDYFEEGRIVTVGARKVVLRDTKKERDKKATLDYMSTPTKKISVLPYDLPFVDIKFVPVPREFFGIGIPEILSDDQYSIDLIRSQRLDNLEILLNLIWKLRIGSDTDPDSVYSAPGQIIPVTDMGDLEPVDFRDVTANSYKEQETLIKRGEDAVGEYEYGRGQTPQRRETATGIVRLQEASNVRPDLVNKLIEFTGVRPLGIKIIQIIREFMPEEYFARIIGDKYVPGFYEYEIDDILAALDVKPQGASITADKDVRQQQVEMAQGLLLQENPNMAQQNNPPYAVNRYEVLRMALEQAEIKNIDKLIVKTQPQPQQPQQPQPPQPPQQPPQPQGQPQQAAQPMPQQGQGFGF